ncbi:helix-turn-helix domain-containing protein, partial [Vibrio parahaemolyticus]|uniref:helix-turn-helix domain-containing protein n=1 Tax=Vibrio parahaemolyticus TaxID=670 RepID=UPI00177C9A46
MKRMFSEQEREFVFDSWKRGVGFSEIAQQLDVKPGTVFTMLRDTGGIKPPKRQRKVTH